MEKTIEEEEENCNKEFGWRDSPERTWKLTHAKRSTTASYLEHLTSPVLPTK